MMEQNRLSHSARTIILLVLMAVLAACEKPILDDAATAVGGKDGGDSDVTPVTPEA